MQIQQGMGFLQERQFPTRSFRQPRADAEPVAAPKGQFDRRFSPRPAAILAD
jgi:hypothetical protein